MSHDTTGIPRRNSSLTRLLDAMSTRTQPQQSDAVQYLDAALDLDTDLTSTDQTSSTDLTSAKFTSADLSSAPFSSHGGMRKVRSDGNFTRHAIALDTILATESLTPHLSIVMPPHLQRQTYTHTQSQTQGEGQPLMRRNLSMAQLMHNARHRHPHTNANAHRRSRDLTGDLSADLATHSYASDPAADAAMVADFERDLTRQAAAFVDESLWEMDRATDAEAAAEQDLEYEEAVAAAASAVSSLSSTLSSSLSSASLSSLTALTARSAKSGGAEGAGAPQKNATIEGAKSPRKTAVAEGEEALLRLAVCAFHRGALQQARAAIAGSVAGRGGRPSVVCARDLTQSSREILETALFEHDHGNLPRAQMLYILACITRMLQPPKRSASFTRSGSQTKFDGHGHGMGIAGHLPPVNDAYVYAEADEDEPKDSEQNTKTTKDTFASRASSNQKDGEADAIVKRISTPVGSSLDVDPRKDTSTHNSSTKVDPPLVARVGLRLLYLERPCLGPRGAAQASLQVESPNSGEKSTASGTATTLSSVSSSKPFLSSSPPVSIGHSLTRPMTEDEKDLALLRALGDGGNAAALSCLAACHHWGWGVAKNLSTALSCLHHATSLRKAHPSPVAHACLATVLLTHPPAALAKAGADNITTPVKGDFATTANTPSGPNHPDRFAVRAVHHLNISAALGNAAAQTNLAICHLHGVGSAAVSDALALHWLRLASEQRDPRAFEYLALCAYDGRGMQKNQEQAHEYMRTARKLGNPNAPLWLRSHPIRPSCVLQ